MITVDTNIQISRNFKLSEFRCHCGKEHVELDMELAEKLQVLRDLLGDPLTVAVGYRCPEHNAKTPNADPNSWHKFGKAADIKSSRHAPEEVFYLAKKAGFNGVGLYDTWVHVDVGPGAFSSWDKREKHKGRKVNIPL